MISPRYVTSGILEFRGLTADIIVPDSLNLPVSLGANNLRADLYDVQILAV